MKIFKTVWNFVERFFRKTFGSAFLLIIVGAIAINLFSDGFMALLTILFPNNEDSIWWIVLLGGFLLLVVAYLAFLTTNLARTYHPLRKKMGFSELKDIPAKRGLIAIVSMGLSTPAEKIIEYYLKLDENQQCLQVCWLIYGPGKGELSSEENAKMFESKYEEKLKIIPIPIENEYDPEEMFIQIQKIYTEMTYKYQLTPEEVIADFTGGTKCMTSGLVLGCIDHGIQLQFLVPETKKADGRAKLDTSATPEVVNLKFFDSK